MKGRPAAPFDHVEFAVNVLAVHRLTRLATADVITAPPRDALIRAIYVRSHGEE